MKPRSLAVVAVLWSITALVTTLSPARCLSAAGSSANGIGYVDVPLRAGSNFIANPFIQSDASVSNLLRGLPDGSYLLTWDGWKSEWTTNEYSAGSGWSIPNQQIPPPDGFILWVPVDAELHFTGEIPLRTSVIYEASQSSAASWTRGGPPDGRYRPRGHWILGFMPQSIPPDTYLRLWNPDTQQFGRFTYLSWDVEPGWYDEQTGFRANPIIRPGQAGLFWNLSDLPVGLFLDPTPSSNPPPRFVLENPRKHESGLTFNLATPAEAPVWVLQSTNIKTDKWEVVQRFGSNQLPVTSFTITNANQPAAFFRVAPTYSGSYPEMLNFVRTKGNFRFTFYASSNSTYQVRRASTLISGATVWSTITNVTATTDAFLSVTDHTAHSNTFYYSLFWME